MTTTQQPIDESYLRQVYDPLCSGDGSVNLPSQFDSLPEEIKTALLLWIRTYIVPAKTFDPNNTSYGLKHKFQNDTGHYVYNGAFKGAMLQAGFRPKDVKEINWQFNSRLSREWRKQAQARRRAS